MFQGQLFVLLIIYVGDSSCAIATSYDAGKELWKLYSMLDEAQFNSNLDTWDIAELFTGKNVDYPKIGNQMERVHEQLVRLDHSVQPKIIRDLFRPSPVMLYRSMDTFELFISSIDTHYENFHREMNDNSQLPHTLLHDLERSRLNVQDHIRMIRKIVTDAKEFLPDYRNLVVAITDYTMVHQGDMCNFPDMISNILIRIFKMSIIAEIKVNIIVAFSNLHRYARNGSWKFDNLHARRQFQKWFGIYTNLLEENLAYTDTLYTRACEPDNDLWIRNESFYELEGTFQTTIFRHDYATCNVASCESVLFKEPSDCGLKAYDDRLSCSGLATDCVPLFAVQACILKEGPYKFQYVNLTASGRYYGKNFECPRDSGYMITDGMVPGSNDTACACKCYGNHNKISLSLMESRTNLNMVITGVRFFRENNVLYIQPREGKLDSDGRIDQISERWVPIPSNSQKSQIHTIDQNNKVFFLDDVRLPANYVLTGVKWNKVTREPGEGFALEIFGVPFDYIEGNLILQSSTRISNELSENDAGEEFPGIDTSERGWMFLEQSSFQEDFGQATVPFFDAVQIAPNSSLLGGIGISYKRREGSLGFFTMMVYGIQFANYFRDFIDANIEDDSVTSDNGHRKITFFGASGDSTSPAYLSIFFIENFF